jgi:DNA ligase D-like protein (predicted 3'-phosphoesterase)
MSQKKKFVIQKHDASRLHYDFRLETGDSLLSWAIPKGLSMAANKKRLAIRTKDHSPEAAEFEGVIEAGEYGAGTVMIWDRGDYEPILEDNGRATMHSACRKGTLKFCLHGEKIEGLFAMARTGERDGKEQWVIFKLDDEHADARRNPQSTQPDSVVSGRSIEEIAEEEEPTSFEDE